jgi:hypothetical protein
MGRWARRWNRTVISFSVMARSAAAGTPELFDLGQAHALYQALLGPVDALIKDKSHLIIVPYEVAAAPGRGSAEGRARSRSADIVGRVDVDAGRHHRHADDAVEAFIEGRAHDDVGVGIPPRGCGWRLRRPRKG